MLRTYTFQHLQSCTALQCGVKHLVTAISLHGPIVKFGYTAKETIDVGTTTPFQFTQSTGGWKKGQGKVVSALCTLQTNSCRSVSAGTK